MTFVNVSTVLWIVVFMAFTANNAFEQRHRTDLQVAADAINHSVGSLAARHMNALTTANHSAGEALSFVIVHHAIGGDNLDNNETGDTEDVDEELEKAREEYEKASEAAGLPMEDFAYETVREFDGVQASEETTEFDSKVDLKKLLTRIYYLKAGARWMQATNFAPLVAIGTALHTAANVVEAKILQEYQTLNLLHEVAVSLVETKLYLRDEYLPEVKKYTDDIVNGFPAAAESMAREIGRLNNVTGGVIGADGQIELPVEIDPHAEAMTQVQRPSLPGTLGSGECFGGKTQITRDQVTKITQLARATFPWVNYHRQPLRDWMKRLMHLTDTEEYYKDYTDGFSKKITSDLQLNQSMGLYVLKGNSSPDKGYDLWAEEPERFASTFGFLAVSHLDPPSVIGSPSFFKGHHSDGMIAVSQGLVYNANTQVRNDHKIDLTCKRIVPSRQADVGHDTLNWKPGTRPYELVAKTEEGMSPSFPEIRVNWQTIRVEVKPGFWNSLKENSRALPSLMRDAAMGSFGNFPVIPVIEEEENDLRSF